MDIEIEVIGTPIKRTFSQTRIRIGTDVLSDLRLPSEKYPAVQREHVMLEVVRGVLKIAEQPGNMAITFRNGQAAGSGTTVHNGDRLRLGANGPELTVRLLAWETSVAVPIAEPIAEPFAELVADPIVDPRARPAHQPTRLISAAEVAALEAANRPATSIEYQTAAFPSPAAQPQEVAPRPISSRKTEWGEANPGVVTPAPAVKASHAEERESLSAADGRLKMIQLLLAANLVLMAAIGVWVYFVSQQVAASHREILALRAQAKDAVGQFTPTLDSRLDVLQKRMDGMDASMKVAEDRMISRIDQEVPAILDKYLNRKMADGKMGEMKPK